MAPSIGCVIDRVMKNAVATPISSARADATIMSSLAPWERSLASATSAAMRAAWKSTILSISA